MWRSCRILNYDAYTGLDSTQEDTRLAWSGRERLMVQVGRRSAKGHFSVPNIKIEPNKLQSNFLFVIGSVIRGRFGSHGLF